MKVADLDGTRLHIIQQHSGVTSAGGVAYVKLIPLSDRECDALARDRERGPQKRLAATCDGFSFLCTRAPLTAEEVRRELEPLRHSDFRTLLLHLVHGDTVRYPSPYHQHSFTGAECYPKPIYRHGADALRQLEGRGVNYASVLIDAAHEMGMAVHAGLRPGGWSYYHPYADMMSSAFYDEHPEWRTIDRDGTTVARMSWAVPEVRDRVVDVLMEAVALGADGAHIVFNRGLPVVLYEPAFVQAFETRHGADPRQLAEEDERIVQLRCEMVTRFMHQLRERLDQEQVRRPAGRRLALSVCVLGTEADNLRYGIDLRTWSEAGLVDEVHVYRYNFGPTSPVCDMAFLREACQLHGVHVSPMFSPNVDGATVLAEAQAYYGEGADGLGVWDAYTDDVRVMSMWARLGHPEEIAACAARYPSEPVHLPLRSMDGESMDSRFPIYWGG